MGSLQAGSHLCLDFALEVWGWGGREVQGAKGENWGLECLLQEELETREEGTREVAWEREREGGKEGGREREDAWDKLN